MKFSLYDAASGGNRIYTSSGTTSTPTTVSVTVTSGLFSVLIGDTSSGQNAFNIDWNQDSIYLGVTVAADAEMTPRKRLSAVPYAFNSETLQGNYASSSVTSTGGSLMNLHQTTADAATAPRTALFVQTEGTSNANDFLIKGNNGTSDVFTVNRQGNVTSTGIAWTNASGSSLLVSGKNVCLADGTNCLGGSTPSLAQVTGAGATTTATLQLYGGFMAASSTVTSTLTVLGNASLQGLTWTSATGTSATTTNLFSTYGNMTNLTSANGTVTSLSFGNGTSTSWFGFSTASGTTLNASMVAVNGSSVCLLNGINCPVGALVWSDSELNNTIYPATTTRSVLLGGSTTNTAGFIFTPSPGTGTSSLFIGGTTNTNMYVGTSTYGGGLDPNFVMNGNDVFVQGQLGSVGGLFSATSVVVGAGSTFFGDGNLYKTTVGDFSMSLNGLGSNWRFNTGGSEAFTIASTTNVGIGLPTPTEALDVKGNVQNILHSGQTFTTAATSAVGFSIIDQATQGKYLYSVASDLGTGRLFVYDVTDPSSPALISTQVMAGVSPTSIFVQGRYAYMTSDGDGSLKIFDISNPSSVPAPTSIIIGGSPKSVYVSGRYAYVADGASSVRIVDISTPATPVLVSTLSLNSGSAPVSISVQGRYAYVVSNSIALLNVVDVSNPLLPTTVGTSTAFSAPTHIAVSGRYAYVTDSIDSNFYVVDIKDPTAPVTVGTATGFSAPSNVIVSGRYAYVVNGSTANALVIVDVASSTAPNVITYSALSVKGAKAETLSGKYLLVSSTFNKTLLILDVKGVETNSLTAADADLGSLKVQMNGSVANDLTVGNSLNVGIGGVYSQGPIFVAPGATSTFKGDLSIGGGINITGYETVSGVLRPLGNIDQSLPASGASFNIRSSVSMPSTPRRTVVQGHYAYVGHDTGLSVIDVTDPAYPLRVGNYSNAGLGGSFGIAVAGRYAYTANYSSGTVSVIDVSDPSQPTVASTTSVGGPGAQTNDISVVGRYAYVVNAGFQSFQILDVSSPSLPFIVSSTTVPTSDPESIAIRGKYAFITARTTDRLFVYDISQPNAPVLIATKTYSAGNAPGQVVVDSRYAYVILQDSGSSVLSILDISNAALPVDVATSTVLGGSDATLAKSGRYVYAADPGGGTVAIVDVASSTNPISLANANIPPFTPSGVVVAGRYLYVTDTTGSKVSIVDINGMETNGLMAHSAELGSLQVYTNGSIGNDFSVNGGLSVGAGGIYSQGALSVFASSTLATTTSIFNAAANTAPVLDVQGGCSDVDATNILFLAGNTTDNRKFSVRCNGQVFADGAYSGTGADFAEYFRTSGAALAAGEVVVADSVASSTVVRSSAADRSRTIGVVSNNAGFVGNAVSGRESDPTFTVVALIGQVPVNVSDANGSIVAGDDVMASNGGVAVKASGPGMILGRALDSLASGTGTIMVYVSPHWWAGDLLGRSSAGNIIFDSVAMASSTVASALSPTVSSPAFSFTGSAWDAVASAASFSSFSLFNSVMSPTSSSFTIGNASGTPLLTISDLGNTSITGDLTVGKRLFLGSKSSGTASGAYLFADDTVPGSTFISTNADGFQTSSTYDYAERYTSKDDLVPGDLVTADTNGVNLVRRASASTDVILGIVSTRPGFVTGAYTTGTFPIALAGRVPTRISTKNGAIHIGDHVMASDIPGVAVKAVLAGNTVGIALESYDRPEDGLISVFVKTGWQGGTISSNGTISSGVASTTGITAPISHRSGLAKVYAGSTSVKVTFPTIQAFPIIQATPYGQAKSGYWFTNISDTGFTITLGEAPMFDLIFAWVVDPSPVSGTMYFSDNTSAPYDALTGSPVLQAAPATTTVVTTTTTSAASTSATPAPMDATTTTSTAP